jgi:hypothetical protein
MPCNFRVGPLVALAAAGFVLSTGTPAPAVEPSSVAVLYFNGGIDMDDDAAEWAFDYHEKHFGDACTGQLEAALKQRGFHAIPIHPDDVEQAEATAMSQGLTPVRASVDIHPWYPKGSIRNAAHFAKFLFSAPYRELQNLSQKIESHSYAYVRAALIASEKQPVVRPSDLEGRYIYTPNDFNARSDTNTQVEAMLNSPQAARLFGDPSKIVVEPKVKPLSNDLYFVTSHTLLGSTNDKLRTANYVALTMSNVISATLSFGGIDQYPMPDLGAVVHDMLDDVALQCSQANYNEELSELSRLRQSGRNLIPVDLDAFQQQAREDVRKEIDDWRILGSIEEKQHYLELFDQIQALK